MNSSEIARYWVKGSAFVALNVAVQAVLVETGTAEPWLAAAVSTATMPLLGYVAMQRFVFPRAAQPPSHARRFGKYYVTNLSSKALNYVLFLGLLAVGLWYPVAYVAGAGVAFALGFGVNRWIWHGSVTA